MNSYLSKEDLLIMEEIKAAREERQKLADIARNLNLPITFTSSGEPLVHMKDLWEILSDQKSFKELLARARNKVFW